MAMIAKAVIKVLAEVPFADGLFQIAIGGGDHAYVDLHVAHAADAPDDLVLEHAQQLGLQQGRELSNFVEEERAAIGRFEQTLLHCLRVGEGASFVAEEFGLHQRLGDGRAVDGDEWPVLARALVVNRLGDQVFARSAFALDENRGGLAGGDLLYETHQFCSLRRNCDHFVITRRAADLAAQRFDLGAKASRLERVLDGDAEFFEVERLADEVVGAQLKRGLHVIQLRIGRDHDDRRRVGSFLDLLEHLDAAQVGHTDVEQNQVGGLLLGEAEAGFARRGFDDVISPLFALLAQRPAHQAFVVHDQYLFSRHAAFSLLRKGRRGHACGE